MLSRSAAAVLTSAVALLLAAGAQSAGDAVSADEPLPTTISGRYVVSGGINAMVKIGKTVYVGGEFSHIARRTGSAVVVPTRGGRIEPVRAEVAGGPVEAAVADGLGGWYVGGSFSTVGDARRDGLARVRADGTLDRVFDPSALGEVNALALEGDILVVAAAQPETRAVTHALNATTGVELPISYIRPAGAGAARALLANEGRLFIGFGNRRLAAYGVATGTRFWNRQFCESCPQDSGGVIALALQGTKLIIGGGFKQGQSKNLAVLNAGTGTPEGPSVRILRVVLSIAVAKGHVYVAYGRERPGTSGLAVVDLGSGRVRDWGAIRPSNLATDGTTVFMDGRSSKDERNNLTYIQSYVGIYAARAGTGHARLRRVTPTLSSGALPFAPQNGRLLVAGSFTGAGGPVRRNLAAFDTRTGALLPWRPTAADSGCCGVKALAAEGHTIYVAGPSESISGEPASGLAAISADGVGRLLPWHPRLAHADIDALAVGAGRVFASGYLPLRNPSAEPGHVAAFSMRGHGARLPFAPKLNFEFDVGAMTVWHRTLIIGGPSVIAYSVDGDGRRELWRHRGTDYVFAFARRGTTLYAGGNFERVDRRPRHGLAAFALDRHGALLPFAPKVPIGVEALALFGSHIVFGGQGESSYRKTHQVLGAVTVDGKIEPWRVDVPPDGINVESIVPTPGGMVVAGNFNWLGPPGNQAAGGIAWLH
jgi:hypothetical protein